MTIPYTIALDCGGAAIVSVVGGKVLLVVPQSGAVMTRAECEHLGDVLWAAGVDSDPPSKGGAATMITSVNDPRVRNDR